MTPLASSASPSRRTSARSNYTVTSGSISVAMRSPFDLIIKANESGDWLGDRESNPDMLVQSQLSYH